MTRKVVTLGIAVIVLGMLAALPITAHAADPVFTGNEWDTNLVYMVNREDPHANFIAYDSEAEALKNFTLYQSSSPYYATLNGDWKFHWSVNPAGRATEESIPGFTTLGFNDSGWDVMKVPFTWQNSWDLEAPERGYFKYDSIAYTNINYPWRGYGNNTASGGSAAANQDHQIGQAPKVYNAVGTYRRHFTIDPRWKAENRSVTLRFEGVESNCYVWVNGRAVGYAEDSFTTKDFDITDYVDYDGDNAITVQVFRWSSGSFYEDQDFIRASGIIRDVYLVGRSKVTLYDVDLMTTPVEPNVYGDDWNLNVVSYLRSLDGATQAERGASHVEYKLYDGDAVIASYDSGPLTFATVPANIIGNVDNRGKIVSYEYLGAKVDNTLTVAKPRQWSAEQPNLYKLVVTLKQGDTLIETTCFRVGFRESRIINAGTANTRWTINGSRILFYGTDTHETNPETGRYLGGDDLTLLKKDLEIMKTNNVNAIRMSHYPHDRRYYDLADEYGLYIMEEANMENHDNNQLQSNNTYAAAWGPSLRDRQNNSIERTKNNTSVISFSMGNENNSAGTTWAAWNTVWALDRLRSRGDLRPIHAQFRNGEADIQSAMYTVASSWRTTSSATATKPTLLCEYVHAMGNSNGDWDEYIQVFDDMPKTNGGFIWDWVDQSIYTPIPGNPNEKFLAFGGKWEDRTGGFWGNGINDGNFCANGMILGDRTPKPQVQQMKHAYRMITATGVNASTFRINNKNLFTNADYFDQSWTLTENGKVIQSGAGAWSVGPAPAGVSTVTITSADFAVPYVVPEAVKAGAEYAFNVYFKTKADAPWAPAGHIVSESQIPVTDFAVAGNKAALYVNDIDAVDAGDSFDFEGADFALSISKANGAITEYQYKGVDLLGTNPLAGQPAGPIPSFWRADNDNEYGASSTRTALDSWRTVGTGRTTASVAVDKKTLYTKVTVAGVFPGKSNAPYTTTYRIYPNGEVNVHYSYQFPTLSSNQYVHEIGSTMTVNGDFGNLAWFGPRGETYSDRKTGGYSGINESTVKDQFFNYIMAQEMGYHVDTRWFALTDDDGFGIVVKPTAGSAIPSTFASTGKQGQLQFNALYTTPAGLASNAEDAAPTRYRLPYQIRWNDDITLRVNYISTGVGGDNSWGALPLTIYRVNASNQTFSYGYSILPVEAFSVDAAMAYAQTEFTAALNLQDLVGDCEAEWPGDAYLSDAIVAAKAAIGAAAAEDTLADLYDTLLHKYSRCNLGVAVGALDDVGDELFTADSWAAYMAANDYSGILEAIDGLEYKAEFKEYSELIGLLLELGKMDGRLYAQELWGDAMAAADSAWQFILARVRGAAVAAAAADGITTQATVDSELLGHIKVINEMLATLRYASGGDAPKPPVAGDKMYAELVAAEPVYNLDVEFPTNPAGAKFILSAKEFKNVSYVHLRFSYEYEIFNATYFLSDYLAANGFEIDAASTQVEYGVDAQGRALRLVSLYLRPAVAGGYVAGGDIELLYIYLLPTSVPTDTTATLSLEHIDISYDADGDPVDADVNIELSVSAPWVRYFSVYDIDRSGEISLADVDYVRRNLGKDPANDPIIEVRRSDVNHDGAINLLDLMAVIAAYEYNLP